MGRRLRILARVSWQAAGLRHRAVVDCSFCYPDPCFPLAVQHGNMALIFFTHSVKRSYSKWPSFFPHLVERSCPGPHVFSFSLVFRRSRCLRSQVTRSSTAPSHQNEMSAPVAGAPTPTIGSHSSEGGSSLHAQLSRVRAAPAS